jgi:bifunctional aspartokinase / homoserine dehydrogenase 1
MDLKQNKKLIVHKFGGSSLANADKIRNVASIIHAKDEVVLVSAIGKTTRQLQSALDLAKNKSDFRSVVDQIILKHHEIIDDLMNSKAAEKLKAEIEADGETIISILGTIQLIRSYPRNIQEIVLGFGEIFSAQILALFLKNQGHHAAYLKASKVLYVDNATPPAKVDWVRSQSCLAEFLKEVQFDVLVVTGFIANNPEGGRTTLGLNGSDFSAAIFAKLFNAVSLTIWTDVPGVLSANPQQVKRVQPIKRLSYKEALELAYFGATVIHPQTIAPVMEMQIPLWIKSSLEPEKAGTCITSSIETNGDEVVKALTTIEGIALVNIQGAGLIGVSGISSRVFDALTRHGISVIMISQASSEYSICFAVYSQEGEFAAAVIKEAFAHDIQSGNIDRVRLDKGCAIITAVGDGMVGSPGAAGKFFDTLAKVGANIHAIAQGSSERSITAVTKESDVVRALNAVHDAFYFNAQDISVGVIGVGSIGSTFIEQLKQAAPKIFQHKNVAIDVKGVMNSKRMVLSEGDLLGTDWKSALAGSDAIEINLKDFIQHIRQSGGTSVIIDATANEGIAGQYVQCFEQQVSVITPNKYANTSTAEYYHALRKNAQLHEVKFLYETNVCAGLPLINTLQNMVDSGDEILQIEGVLSGTLSYIFSELSAGKSFSQAVLSAYEQGFTEPDPREDLSGMDVARKVVILARESGLQVAIEDLSIENLAPEALRLCDKETFLKALPEHDVEMKVLLGNKKQGKLGLHYIGKIHHTGKVQVGIEAYDKESPFASLSGTDNLVVLQTKRYQANPMVIKGPGAGPDVTAAGIFADLLQLAK